MSEIPYPGGQEQAQPTMADMLANYPADGATGRMTGTQMQILRLIAGEDPEDLNYNLQVAARNPAQTTAERPAEPVPVSTRRRGALEVANRRFWGGDRSRGAVLRRIIRSDADWLHDAVGRDEQGPRTVIELPSGALVTDMDVVRVGDLPLTARDFEYSKEDVRRATIQHGIPLLEVTEQEVEEGAGLVSRVGRVIRPAANTEAESTQPQAVQSGTSRRRGSKKEGPDPRISEVKKTINQLTRRRRLVMAGMAGIFGAILGAGIGNAVNQSTVNTPYNSEQNAMQPKNESPAQQADESSSNETNPYTYYRYRQVAEKEWQWVLGEATVAGLGAALITLYSSNGMSKRQRAQQNANNKLLKMQKGHHSS